MKKIEISLRKCPFCLMAGDDIGNECEVIAVDGSFKVFCGTCGATSNEESSIAELPSRWNKLTQIIENLRDRPDCV